MSIGSFFKKKFKRVGDAFDGDNKRDPFAVLGSEFSPSANLGKELGFDFGGWSAKKAKWNNTQLSDALGTNNDDTTGAGGWIGNKPATTIAALVTGGSLAGGAMNGGAGGSSGTASSGTGGAGSWQQYAKMGMNSQQQGQNQAAEEERKRKLAQLILEMQRMDAARNV